VEQETAAYVVVPCRRTGEPLVGEVHIQPEVDDLGGEPAGGPSYVAVIIGELERKALSELDQGRYDAIDNGPVAETARRPEKPAGPAQAARRHHSDHRQG